MLNKYLKSFSIKYKIITLIMMVSFATTLFISCIFFFEEYRMYKKEIQKEISLFSSIIIKNCIASITFDVAGDAFNTLNSLSINPNIISASIYKANNNVFASFKRNAEIPDINVSYLLNSKKNEEIFDNGLFIIKKNILLDSEVIGYFILLYDPVELDTYIIRKLRYLFASLLFAIVLSLLFSSTLQKIITTPLISLRDAALQLSKNSSSTKRAEKISNDEIGELTESINSMLDIIQQKNLTLQQNEEKMRFLLENAPVAIWSLDKKGIFTHIEGAKQTNLAVNHNDFLNKSFYEVFYDNDEVIQCIKKALEGKKKSCTILYKNYYYDVSFQNVFDENQAVIAAVIDVTENRKIFNENIRFVSAIQHAGDDIIITDKNGLIDYANDAFQKNMGYSITEAMGKSIDILKSHKHDNDFYNNLWFEVKKGNIWKGQFINKKKDGSLLTEDITVSPILSSSKEILGYVFVMRDISEKLKAEEKLRQSQKMETIGVLAGGIAHDFNNILSIIFVYTERLMMELSEDSKNFQITSRILKAAERAKDLVQQILTFSRKKETEFKPMQMDSILKETLKMIRATIPTTIQIFEDIKSKSLIFADPSQIHQIFMNLFTNAAHAMKNKGGTLTVLMHDVCLTDEFIKDNNGFIVGDHIKITIKDTGYGIPQDIIEQIFEPFFTTKKEGEGTGLGLSVVKKIVSDMNGLINVESKVGEGTCFDIFIPVYYKKNGEKIIDKTDNIKSGKGYNILFVDDELSIVEGFCSLFEMFDFKVTGYLHSEEALKEFQKNPEKYDLVFSDYTMPHLTGIELIEKIKKIRYDIAAILFTGNSTGIDEEMLKKAGVDELLLKPLHHKEVLITINKLLKINV